MNRRVFITTASTGTIAALAGCSDFNFGGNDTPNGTNPGFGDDSPANEHYTTALDHLSENDTQLEDVAGSEQAPEEWDNESIQQRVSDAHDALDSAEENAAEELHSRLDNLRAVADFQSAASDYTKAIVELDGCWGEAGNYLQNSAWEDADAHLDDCVTMADEVDSYRTDAESKFDEIDAESLSENTELTYDDISAKLIFTSEEVTVRTDVVRGLDSFVNGMTNVTTGTEHVQNEEYEDAIQQFDEASGLFGSSAETFDKHAGADTPDGLDQDLSELACVASNAEEGSNYFKRGAEEARDGHTSVSGDYFQLGQSYFQKDCN